MKDLGVPACAAGAATANTAVAAAPARAVDAQAMRWVPGTCPHSPHSVVDQEPIGNRSVASTPGERARQWPPDATRTEMTSPPTCAMPLLTDGRAARFIGQAKGFANFLPARGPRPAPHCARISAPGGLRRRGRLRQ